MGKETGISWCSHSFNPWWGCTHASPGCDNCYAELMDRRIGGDHWGKGKPRRTFSDKHWAEPLHWNAAAEAAGVQRRVFCASMADVLDDEAPLGERERLWALIDQTPHLLWLLLTKRPHRYVRYLPANGFKFDNVLLMATTERQKELQDRAPRLREAAMELVQRNRLNRACDVSIVRTGISYEPAIGPLTIRNHVDSIDWVIFGGETGSGRRPVEEQWARDVKAECEAWDIAFFMKQMGAQTPAKAAALIPADLLIRQFPQTTLNY